jgi:ribose transport system substrate-binding protein
VTTTRFRRSALVAAGCCSLLLGLAACGGSDAADHKGSGTTPQANIDKAKQLVESLSAPPQIGYDPGPLPGNPAGKHVTVVLPTTSKGQANQPVFEEVGKELGLQLDIKQVGTSAEEITDLYDQVAADQNMDGLYANSRDPSLWQSQFDQIADRKIPIVLSAITDDPAWTDKSVNVLSADRVVKTISQYAADWMVAQSNGKGSAVVFTIPIQQTLDKIADAYVDEAKTTCPGCSVDRVDVKGFESIGKDLPGTVVSYLQAHPDVKYVFMAFGDMMIGVPDAVRAVGLDDVKLYSQSAGATNIQYLKDGVQAADFGYSQQLMIHVALDALTRGMLGGSMEAADKWMMPTQLLTPDNIDSASVNEDGSLNVAGTDEFFKTLWGAQ